jgi:hypothetical protein
MAGNFILGCFQDPHHLAHTQFPFHKEPQDPEPQRFVECPMKRDDVGYSYMRHIAYISPTKIFCQGWNLLPHSFEGLRHLGGQMDGIPLLVHERIRHWVG